MTDDPSDWIEIRRALSRPPIAEAALVLSSVAIENRIEHHDRQWLLVVRTNDAASALSQLDDYVVENRPSIEFKPRVITFDSGWPGVAGYLFVIWLVPIVAASLGLWMVVYTYMNEGPEITITFDTAAGLRAKSCTWTMDVFYSDLKRCSFCAQWV